MTKTHVVLHTIRFKNIFTTYIFTLCFLFAFLPVSAQNNDDVCALCPHNMYCSQNSISSCPVNTRAPMQSNSYLNCTCTVGYTGPAGGPCTACFAGFYKSEHNSSCIACPVGTISDVGSSLCTVCPANMSADLNDNMTCSCSKGYGLDAQGTCQACNTGQFKNTVGNLTCSICDFGSFSDQIAATECKSCLANEVTLVTGSRRCVCTAGYSRNMSISMSICEACKPGTFKGVAGEMQCTDCTVGFFSPVQASLECTKCPVNMNTSELTGGLCACSPKYGFDVFSDRCKICPAGTYKNLLGNESCIECPALQVSDKGSLQCRSCADNMQFVNHTTCECLSGYEMLSNNFGLCNACSAGYYKDVPGNHACSLCPSNTYTQNVGSTNCTGCVLNSLTTEPAATFCTCVQNYEMNPDSGICDCAQGYENDASESLLTCNVCALGKYKNTLGNYMCRTCDRNTFSDEVGSILCKPCAINSSTSSSGASSCLCDAGHTTETETNTCLPCAPGLFKNNTGNSTCLPCPLAKYTNVEGSLFCLHCQANTTTLSIGRDSALDCLCGSGFGYNQNTESCASCPNDSYKTLVSNEECVKKPFNGFYLRLRLPISINNFTENLKQTLINIIAGILKIDVYLVSILQVQDLSLTSVTRRLLQSGPNTLVVEMFVNSSTVNMTLLTELEINDILQLLYPLERLSLPYVLLENIDFVPEEIVLPAFTTTPLHVTNKNQAKTNATSLQIILGVAAGLIFVVFALIWAKTLRVQNKIFASNVKFQQIIDVPELPDNNTKNILNVAEFYNVSRASNFRWESEN